MHKGLAIVHNPTLLVHFVFHIPICELYTFRPRSSAKGRTWRSPTAATLALPSKRPFAAYRGLLADPETFGLEITYGLQLLCCDGLQCLDGFGCLEGLATLDKVRSSCDKPGAAYVS